MTGRGYNLRDWVWRGQHRTFRRSELTQPLKWSWTIALTSLAILAMACGADGETPTTGGEDARAAFAGKAPQPTPTLEPAAAEATQASSNAFAGAFGGLATTAEVTAAEAADHIGKQVKVCGTVANSVHHPEHKYKVTLLHFDKAEDPDFVAYFWLTPRLGSWPDVADPSIDITTWFTGKAVCVQGRMEQYQQTPGINASNWRQIEILDQ